MTTEHLIGIGDERPRETEVTHCARGQIYLDMKYSAPAAMLYPQAALDAAVAAERERCARIADDEWVRDPQVSASDAIRRA